MKNAKIILLIITAALCLTITQAVDTSDLNHLINLELQLQDQLRSNNSVNLEQLESNFLKTCYANDARENFKQMQREFGVFEDKLQKWYKPDDFCTGNEQIKRSVYNFANYAKDCFQAKDIKQANVLNRVIEVVDDFFCFKDGDRLLMFLAESGEDCLKNNEATLRQCSKESFGTNFNASADFARLLYFFMAENKCSVMNTFWSCASNELEKNCKSTAFRILTDILENVKIATACDKTKQNKRDVMTDDEQKLNNFFKGRCNHFDYTEFTDGVNKLSFCFQTGYQRLHTVIDAKQFCQQEEKQLKECFYSSVDQISSCFKREEKFLTEFLKLSLKSMLKYVCDNDARKLREYFSDSGKKCSKMIVDASAKDDGQLEHCLDRVFSPSGGAITKEEICRDLSVAEECTSRYINKTCPGNGMYQNLGRGFIHSLQAPCGSGCVICWNLLVFVFISFIIAKFL